jgi:hypothetical protein
MITLLASSPQLITDKLGYRSSRRRIIDVSGEIGFVWQKSQKDIHETKSYPLQKKYNFKLYIVKVQLS